MNRKTSTAQLDWINTLPDPEQAFGQSLDATQTLQCLQAWAQAGWLRRLDAALAAQLLRLQAQASPALLVAAALLAHMEGRGHTCLPLSTLLQAPSAGLAWLGWPAVALQGEQGLTRVWAQLPATLDGWRQALNSPSHAHLLRHAAAADAGQPLVLGGTGDAPLLYLRRYAA